jgi:hypothetical protein
MEMWDGGFEMPGEAPTYVPSSHVPVRTMTTADRPVVVADMHPSPAAATPPRLVRSHVPKRQSYDTTVIMTFGAMIVMVTMMVVPLIPWFTSTPLPVNVRRISSVIGSIAAVITLLGWIKIGSEAKAEIVRSEDHGVLMDEKGLAETCERVRGAYRHHRPSGSGLYDRLVEATHRCCRITNIAGDTGDVQVIETVAMIRSRLPSILKAFQRTKAVADPEECRAALDRMAEAVIMLGDQAEEARKRLLAHATDGLETEVRYLSTRTGRDSDGFSSMLGPVV